MPAAPSTSEGFPDFDPPPELLAALHRAADSGKHQYAVTWGAANFRRALAAKASRFMKMAIDPERQVVVTCGSTEAMIAGDARHLQPRRPRGGLLPLL